MLHNDPIDPILDEHTAESGPAKKMAVPRVRIHKLPIELANQIAAGEVIERPASVLKELLENSLDAGSTQIDIVIEQGGIGLIKVQDNGCGIHQEDLMLALAPHATSKVASLHDLEAICSFGFRGEALASIASVSKLTLLSCTESQTMGCIIEKSGREQAFTQKPAPRILGTTLEVKDLFYNTPARRQFLRSEKTETAYLEEVFKRIALSHPEVGFSIKFSSKTATQLPRCLSTTSYTRRVAELCGKTFIQHAQYVEAESNGLTLRGWIGGKEQLRSSADLQYFYVNGRIIRDKLINHALRQAYQDSYALGRYPAYILFLELDPASIDVNVHPTKHEVRFREARILHAFLTYALQETLASSKPVPAVQAQENSVITQPVSTVEPTQSSLAIKSTAFTDQALYRTPSLLQASKQASLWQNEHGSLDFSSDDQEGTSPATAASNHNQNSTHAQLETNNIAPNLQHLKAESQELKFGQPITLLMGEILVLAKDQEIAFVNVKACDALIVTEQLKEKKNSKMLIIPCSIKIANQRNLTRIAGILQSVGFQWTESGTDHILLRAVPAALSNSSTADEILNKILEHSALNKNAIIELIAKISMQHRVYSIAMAQKVWRDFLILHTKNSPNPSAELHPNLYYKNMDLKNLRKLLFS